MLYVTRYTMRRTSRAQFFLRASLSDAWSAVTAKPNLDEPFIDPKVQERQVDLARAPSIPKLIAQPLDEQPRRRKALPTGGLRGQHRGAIQRYSQSGLTGR
jgi:hypothetical protein